MVVLNEPDSTMNIMANQFSKGNQIAWFHDEGDASGVFHTYDALKPGTTEPHKVHVFIPRDYETSRDRYPVIYMNDGDTAFFRGGAINESWYMAKVLGDLYQSGKLRPTIVVAIYPRDREYEYTHTNIMNRKGGGIAAYARYVAKEIKGFIDANYRTQSEPSKTLILGASHGGLAAFLMGMLEPQAFGNVAAFSPSFWVGLDSNPIALPFLRPIQSSKLVEMSDATLRNPQRRPKIYMDWGLIRDGQFHNNFIEGRTTTRGQQLRDWLVDEYHYQLNQNLFVVEDVQGEHSELSWRRRVPSVLPLFF